MTRAVYAGSFDPPTRGHEYVMQYAASMVQELVVAVGINPAKKTMFTERERLSMLNNLALHYPNVVVDSFKVKEYLVNYASRIDAQYVVRGIRNTEDFLFEQVMFQKNHTINSNVKTIFVMTDLKYATVSSSTVKALIGPEGWVNVVRQDIPEAIWDEFYELITTKYGLPPS